MKSARHATTMTSRIVKVTAVPGLLRLLPNAGNDEWGLAVPHPIPVAPSGIRLTKSGRPLRLEFVEAI